MPLSKIRIATIIPDQELEAKVVTTAIANNWVDITGNWPPKPTKQEMVKVVDYLRNTKSFDSTLDDTLTKLAKKYGVSLDQPESKIADKFQNLIELTKTTGGQRQVLIKEKKK